MTPNEYQKESYSTRIYTDDDKVIYTSFGLADEACELLEAAMDTRKVFNFIADWPGWKERFCKEAGDVLWYISGVAQDLDVPLYEVVKRSLKEEFVERADESFPLNYMMAASRDLINDDCLIMDPSWMRKWHNGSLRYSVDDVACVRLSFEEVGSRLVVKAGKVAGLVKKWIRDGKKDPNDPSFRTKMIDALSETLIMLDEFVQTVELDLETVAQENIKKLRSRQQRGTLQGSGDNR